MLINKCDIKLIGALTSKPYAFKSRPWELKSIDSIDLFDSLNSNIKVNIRGNNIMRILPVTNESINEEWISDKARFSFDGLNKWRFITPMFKNHNIFEEIDWKNAFNIIKEKINKSKSSEIIIDSGNFNDLESLTSLKTLKEETNNAFFSTSNFLYDLQEDYLINENFKNIKSPKVLIIVGCNFKIENPVFNIKLRKLSKQSNVLMAYIGPYYDFNTEMLHLGNNINILKKIYEGKHWFCSYLTRFLKKTNKSVKIKNLLKNDISIIFGSCYFEQNNNKNNYNFLKWNKNKMFNTIFNVFVPYSGEINRLELGLYENIKIKTKQNKIFYELGTDRKNKIKKEDFIIFQGHHNDKNRKNINVILPTVNWFEKNSLYLNCFGMLQKTTFILSPPTKSRSDWKIIQMLNIYLNNKLNFNTIKELYFKLNNLSPCLTESLNNYLHLNNSIFIKKKIWNKNAILNNVIMRTTKHDYYSLTSIERASKVMKECSYYIFSKKNNYIIKK